MAAELPIKPKPDGKRRHDGKDFLPFSARPVDMIALKGSFAAEFNHYLQNIKAPLIEIPTSLLDSIVQAQTLKDSVLLGQLKKIRAKFIEPFAMSQDSTLHASVLELSDILGDPDYAKSLLRLRKLGPQTAPQKAAQSSEIDLPPKAIPRTKHSVSETKQERTEVKPLELSPEARQIYSNYAEHSLPLPGRMLGGFEHLDILTGDKKEYIAKAEEAEEFFQALVDENVKVVLDDEFVERTIAMLEGGTEWANKMYTFAEYLLPQVKEGDKEEFIRLIHDYGYAKTFSIKSYRENALNKERASSPRYRKAKRVDSADEYQEDDDEEDRPSLKKRIGNFFKRSA